MTASLRVQRSLHGHGRVWEDPSPGLEYVIGADVAEGKARDQGRLTRSIARQVREARDYSSAHVLERRSGEICCAYHGSMNTAEFARALYLLGLWYNSAEIAVEVTGPGNAVEERLEEWGYEALYAQPLDPLKMVRVLSSRKVLPLKRDLGWKTTSLTRPLLLNTIHDALADKVPMIDDDLLGEIQTVELDKVGKARGIGSNKDDRVFSYAIAQLVRIQGLQLDVPDGDKDDPYKDLPPDHAATWRHVAALIDEKESQNDNADY